jgi:glutamate--cysteine ligase catalytic subunit
VGRRGGTVKVLVTALCADECCQVEYLVVCYDEEHHKVRLSLRQADILQALAADEKLLNQGGGVPDLQRGPEK